MSVAHNLWRPRWFVVRIVLRLSQWTRFNLIHQKQIWSWVNSDVERIERDTVGGGWVIKTSRGYFKYSTLKKTVEEAWSAR